MNHVGEATLPACVAVSLLCTGILGPVQKGSFIASADSSLALPFPTSNSGVLMSFTPSSPHPRFLLRLTVAFSV